MTVMVDLMSFQARPAPSVALGGSLSCCYCYRKASVIVSQGLRCGRPEVNDTSKVYIYIYCTYVYRYIYIYIHIHILYIYIYTCIPGAC